MHPWVSSDANMARRARHGRQRAWKATEALAAMAVGETYSRSHVPCVMQGCGRNNCVVVDIISFQEGSVIDVTSIGTVQATSCDEEG
ncbi:Peptidyl-prolyl cis-trans isomerase CYP40 [Hordeum vulgare]|nr:Peptidyl-prolyl cis-trans isomerase CYP40 [Hordeum vulgare]